MFELIPSPLKKLLERARDGNLQLPDFQRGWVWEQDAIASLLASVARSFPVGALLTLKTGGALRFAPRTVEGSPARRKTVEPEELLLDGQQRVTSLFQAFMRQEPVETRTAQGKKREVLYYFNIIKSTQQPFPDDAIEIVPASKAIRGKFGRGLLLDLREEKDEYSNMRYPANRVFDHDDWFEGWMKHWEYNPKDIKLFNEFRKRIIEPIRDYKVPVIRLEKETTKEAVCLVFEKVNTGGKKLDAFELLTAIFAATGEVNLRDDWLGQTGREGRKARLHKLDVLRGVSRSDFLRAVSLAHTHDRRRAAKAAGKSDQELPQVSCKHAALLDIPASGYVEWCDEITVGFERAAKFLYEQGLFWWKDVPYPAQITALAAFFASRKNKELPVGAKEKVEQWFWCGIFGELYGSSTDSRLANDVEDLSRWLAASDQEPRTIRDAMFSESRLDTLYTRNSAAYKGIYALLLKGGVRDFLTDDRISIQNYLAQGIDIHHIFPRAWCESAKPLIPRERYNTIVNKTAISSSTNRTIGGKAPSAYCRELNAKRGLGRIANDSSLEKTLSDHRIGLNHLRSDDFDAFYAERKSALLELIETGMGKVAHRDGDGRPEDYDHERIAEGQLV